MPLYIFSSLHFFSFLCVKYGKLSYAEPKLSKKEKKTYDDDM